MHYGAELGAKASKADKEDVKIEDKKVINCTTVPQLQRCQSVLQLAWDLVHLPVEPQAANWPSAALAICQWRCQL